MPVKNELKKTFCFPNKQSKDIFTNFFEIIADINNTSPSNEHAKFVLDAILPRNTKCREWACILLADRNNGINNSIQAIYRHYAALPWDISSPELIKPFFDFTVAAFDETGGSVPNHTEESHYFFSTLNFILDQLLISESIENEEDFLRNQYSIEENLFWLQFNLINARKNDDKDFFANKDYLHDLFDMLNRYWGTLSKNTYFYRLMACITRMQKFVNTDEKTLKILGLIKDIDKQIES